MAAALPIDTEGFQIRSRLEVIAILRALIERAALVTLYFGTGEDFIVTAVLAVVPNQDMLILDCGADAAANHRALAATELRAATQLDHIRIEFAVGRGAGVIFEDRPALRFRIPASLTRLQRRESYRLKVPMSRAVYFRLPFVEHGAGQAPLRVYDLSVGGVALIDLPRGGQLVPGAVLKNCRIDLPDIGTVPSDVEIIHITEMRLPNAQVSRRCGCRFLNLTPGTITMIQRYINRVERDSMAHD